MANFLAIIQLVNQLFPLLLETIKTVETAFPPGSKGATKLDMVRTVLQGAYDSLGQTSIAFSTIWPMLQNIIAGTVAMYNASGIFKSATPTGSQTVAAITLSPAIVPKVSSSTTPLTSS